MELPFAALHQLCGPVLGRLARLPGPQRDALGLTEAMGGTLKPEETPRRRTDHGHFATCGTCPARSIFTERPAVRAARRNGSRFVVVIFCCGSSARRGAGCGS